MLGVDREHLVGRRHPELIPAANRKQYEQALADASQNGSWRGEFPLLRPDGTTVMLDLHASVLEQGNVLILATDITERKRTEEELRIAQERLRLALSAGDVATWLWDIPSDRIYGDANLRVFYNITEEQANGGTADVYMNSIHPEDRERAAALINDAIVSGAPGYEGELRLIGSDGKMRWVLGRGVIERNEAGEPVRIPGVLFNITERKKIIDELREADRRKGSFLATLAHELRNPLAPLMNGLHILELAGDDRHMIDHTREMMLRQMKHLVRMVDDLMDVNRINRGMIELRKQPIDLRTTVSMAIETVLPHIKAKQQELLIDAADAPVMVLGDPTRLTQIISNLVSNANRYTGEHGRIVLSLQATPSEAILKVIDNGIGIDPHNMPAAFELFSQLGRNGASSVASGLGIGLNIVKQLVELHGGGIEGQSEGEGAGCIFTVRLPLIA